jgi:rifampicin phosphotransferase
MSDYVIPLSDPLAVDDTLVGTKAASLARIINERLPVPGGFVLTTTAYRDAVATFTDTIEHLGASRSTSQNALKEASADIRKHTAEVTLPRGLNAQIKAQWTALGRIPVSVRSSSTAEDLEDASFAGQYDSFLNVTTYADLLAKIRQVWASLHSPHAIRYRRKHALAHEDASMAVLIQVQLEPVASGVMFTRDPVTGANQFVINAAYGLGEGVVAGNAETDRYVLGPRGSERSAEIGIKKVRIVPAPQGGIESNVVARAAQKRRVLTGKLLSQLHKHGRHLAGRFGGPQDIEYAVVGGRVQILQSRPITAIEPEVKPDVPWNRGVNRRHTWNRRGGPFRRLELDVSKRHLKYLKVCYDETGSSMTLNHVGVYRNGYLYVRPNPASERALEKRHKLQTARVDRSLRKGKSYFEDALQGTIEKRHAKLNRQKARAKTLASRVAYLDACIEMEAYVQANLHWRQGKPGGRKNWHDQFAEITGEPKHHANVFVQAIENRMTMAIDRIRELARIVQSDRELNRIFETREFEGLKQPNIRKRAKTKQFQTRFRAMMRIYGIRAGHGYGTESNLQTLTWNLDHRIPYEFIATYAELDLNRLDREERAAIRERDRTTAQLRKKLSKDPEKLKQFDDALQGAIIGVKFLEDHNYYMEQCSVGMLREAFHLVGKTLVDRGQIDEPDDVYHFSITDLQRIAGSRNIRDLRQTVANRSDERDRKRRMKPPATIGKRPSRKKQDGDTPKAGLDGNVVYGQSASSGQVTGRAVIATSGEDHPQLHPGDILVAGNVGPDWTPLFATIGGLVLNSGSLGQHAALMAREYKIPSVMQTKEATRVIRNGQRIRVDGDAGTVELLESQH